MPTFPQHRNMRPGASAAPQKANNNGTNPPPPPGMDTGSNDQTMNLPAISDLV